MTSGKGGRRTRTHAPRLAREQRVDEILCSARDVFCEKGYDAASMAEIASRIGVVEGLVYKYFPSKRALLLRVLEHWYDEMFGDCERELAGVSGPRERIRTLIWRHLRTVRDYPQLCSLMFVEVHQQPHYRGSTLHLRNRRYTRYLIDEIEAAQRDGTFRSELPAALVRNMVYGGIEHVTWSYMSGGGSLEIDPLADQITALLCDGLTVRAPALPPD